MVVPASNGVQPSDAAARSGGVAPTAGVRAAGREVIGGSAFESETPPPAYACQQRFQ